MLKLLCILSVEVKIEYSEMFLTGDKVLVYDNVVSAFIFSVCGNTLMCVFSAGLEACSPVDVCMLVDSSVCVGLVVPEVEVVLTKEVENEFLKPECESKDVDVGVCDSKIEVDVWVSSFVVNLVDGPPSVTRLEVKGVWVDFIDAVVESEAILGDVTDLAYVLVSEAEDSKLPVFIRTSEVT